MMINLFAQISMNNPGYYGICMHTNSYCSALSKITEVSVYDTFSKTLAVHERDNKNIIINHATFFSGFSKLRNYKIGYTFFELTELDDNWKKGFESVDEIWVPSQWGKSIIEKHTNKKVVVIPEGINPDIFYPKENVNYNLPDGFKFLCVGKLEQRKSIIELVQAFTQEFQHDNDVYLILNCHASFTSNKKVVFLNTIKNNLFMPELYNSCQAFVLPTKAEGWGLPILEAMACGLPTITTNYSGQTEFINEDDIHSIKYDLVKAEPIGGQSGVWAQPDIDHLRFLMRNVYNNYKQCKEKALEVSKNIRTNWTWDKSAEKTLLALGN